MKKHYLIALTAFTTITFAQQNISFETDEGFQLGSIHTQNGWEVAEGSNGFIQNQVITDEKATEGIYSFKNAYEPDFNEQWMPIFGAAYTFSSPADYNYFTISYDVLATNKNGADFELVLFAVNDEDEYVPVAGVGIENRGYIYFTKDINYGFDYAQAEWSANTWINIKIEVTGNEINYYVNGILDHTITNFTHLNIAGFNMLHNNYGESAYYDNFIISTSPLSIEDQTFGNFMIYPNPARDILHYSSTGETVQLLKAEVFNLNGQKVAEGDQKSINISHLAAGTYLLKASTSNGKSITRKVVKK